jgi:CO/xanthine dehydrogenase Mo-binding subunit
MARPSTIGKVAAIANAVFDATGKRVRELAIVPVNVLL